MTDYAAYVNEAATQFGADTLRVPASYALGDLEGVVVAIDATGGEELEQARVCELLAGGVVVARARLS